MFGSPKLIVSTFYRTLFTVKQYTDTYYGVVEAIQQKKHTAHFILRGDYNIGDIDWETLSVRPGGIDVALCNQNIQMAEDHSSHKW